MERVRRSSSVRGRIDCSLDEEDNSHSILRKHQSLPPKRKNVHFADGFGKPLVSVYSDEEYNIHVALAATKRELQKSQKTLTMCFTQPVALDDFRERLENHFVCLENAIVSRNSIMGTVKVKNIAYHKEVLVRYSLDAWHSFTDVPASYVQDSFDGNCDRFSFAVTIPEYFLATGGDLSFALCFRNDGQEFWDNNCGSNYRIECKEHDVGVSNTMANPTFNGF